MKVKAIKNSQITLFNILLENYEVLNNFGAVFYEIKWYMLGLSSI